MPKRKPHQRPRIEGREPFTMRKYPPPEPTVARVEGGWAKNYVDESDPVERNRKLAEEDKKKGRNRRRIEDILEASRLEDELFNDWE